MAGTRHLEPIEVIIIRASDLKNCDVSSAQDPYCRLSIGSATVDTGVVVRGGSNPEWTADAGTVRLIPEGVFDEAGDEHLLHIDIFDRDCVTKDDLVGRACVRLAAVARRCAVDAVLSWRSQVHVYRGISRKGLLEVEIRFQESHANLARSQRVAANGAEELLEATPVKINSNLLPGVLHAVQEGDAVGGFVTYAIALQQVQDIFGDVWNFGRDGQHPETFKEDAKGAMLRGALSAVHQGIYSSFRTQFSFLSAKPNDFLGLIQNGIREGRRRVFTYAVTDSGLFFSETGAALSKDNFSKHAIHADGAMAVRYAGTFRICERDRVPVLVIDNDSGTYMPKAEFQDRLKRVLELNLPGLDVICLNVCEPQPAWTKDFVGPVEQKGQDHAVYAGTWTWRGSSE